MGLSFHKRNDNAELPPSRRWAERSLFLALVVCVLGAALSGCVQIISGPPPPSAEALKGLDELKKNNLSRARELFDTAINKDRTNHWTYLYVMEYYLQTLHPQFVGEYFERGQSALARSKVDERVQFLVAASATLESAGFRTESIRACEEAYRLRPNNPETQNALAYAYAQDGKNLERAIELATSAIKSAREQRVPEQDLGAIVDTLGWAYFKNQQVTEAIRTLASAADLAPAQQEIQYHLGVAYYDAGKYKDAKIALTRARAGGDLKGPVTISTAKLQNAVEEMLTKVNEKLEAAKEKDPGPSSK